MLKNKIKNITKNIILVLCLSLSMGIQVEAGALYEKLNEEAQLVAQEMWDYYRVLGYTEEATAGILGNVNAESAFDIKINENNDKSYFGLYQIGKAAKYSDLEKVGREAGLEDITGMVAQILYVESSLEGDFKGTSTYTYEEFKKETDVQTATHLFAIAFERCVGGSDEPLPGLLKDGYGPFKYQHLTRREEYAEDIYVTMTGRPVPQEGTSLDDGLVVMDGGVGYVDPLSGQVVSITERKLTLSNLDDLDTEGVQGVKQWKDNIEQGDPQLITWVREMIMIVGILLIIYSVFLYLGYWLDRVNNFIELNVVPIISLGRLRISPEEHECTYFSKGTQEGSMKTINHKAVLCICGIGIFVGMYIVSGMMYDMLNTIIVEVIKYMR